MPKFLQIETRPGRPISVNGARLLPFAQSISLRLPGGNAGLVWHRPVSVLVTDTSGKEQILEVRDPTRQIVWTMYAAAGLLAVSALVREFRRKAHNERR
jgi:hypothetical protein